MAHEDCDRLVGMGFFLNLATDYLRGTDRKTGEMQGKKGGVL
jgi:hypothetical protein